jgi:hypothetical protein
MATCAAFGFPLQPSTAPPPTAHRPLLSFLEKNATKSFLTQNLM